MKEIWDKYLIVLYEGVPTAVYVGMLLVFCLFVVTYFILNGFKEGYRIIAKMALAEYVLLLFCSTVFFRKSVEIPEYNFHPFWSYEASQQDGMNYLLAENAMNVVAFMPIGALLCGAFQSMTWWKAALIAGGLSISVEVMQFVYRLGFAEVDDVMHNIIGCVLGYMLVKGSWLMVKGCKTMYIHVTRR